MGITFDKVVFWGKMLTGKSGL